jgi:purine-binding chemotaxis protein CheW
MEQQLVVFNLAHERYGVDIAAVQGIIKMQAITALPQAPEFVEGVINLRGQVLPVIDLRKRLGLPQEAHTLEKRIMVVEVEGETVGMIVDGVSEVLRIATEATEPPSPVITTANSAFVQAIAKVGERLITLVDLSQLLRAEQPASLKQVPVAA